ncbi:inositol monophosphatase family protein [Nocardioides islandensis]|uniref:inositol monophosphatase family protein n=1 Tax=Nocardioides islandensis TaxID=433663 RepID=UPI002B26A621|nr:inositol monophosphatase family protein [Nocardioides islandensis]
MSIDGFDGQLRDLALEAARQASALIRERRTHDVTVADTKTSDVDVVTQPDRESEALIRSIITSRRPDDEVLGEEEGTTSGSSGVRWVVDPIDGTVNYLYGLPEYSVSIAAEVDGSVVAGVVVNAATGVEYVATEGDARRDGVPLSCRGPAPLHRRLVITGFSYEAGKRVVQAQAVARLLPDVRDIRRLGSCALDLCHLAEGTADAYVEEGVQLWDYAAGAFIARQAGVRTEMHPGRYGTPALVAAPEHGFDEFLAAVTDAGFLSTGVALESGPDAP